MTERKLTLKEQAELLRKGRMQQPSRKADDPMAQQSWPVEDERLQQSVLRQRREMVLEEEILSSVSRGYHVVSRSETSAQLVMPKGASCLWLTFWIVISLGSAIPLLILYYLVKPQRGLYLRVTPSGSLEKVHSGPLLSLGGWFLLFIVFLFTVPLAVILFGFIVEYVGHLAR